MPSESHILDLPSPIDDLRLMCGKLIQNAAKGDNVALHTALATCIPCLRAFSLKLEGKVARLEMRMEQMMEKKVEATAVNGENAVKENGKEKEEVVGQSVEESS